MSKEQRPEARQPVGRLRPFIDLEVPKVVERGLDIARLQPFGRALAGKVADLLESGRTISYSHRDHCGTGLKFTAGMYVYDEVDSNIFNYSDSGDPEQALAAFFDRDSFVAWLSFQNDESLSGRETGNVWYTDNQRITRARLEEEVAAWLADTSPP